MQKLNNSITINVNDETRAEIEKIAEFYQRKPAELLRMLLVPVLTRQYAIIQRAAHPENMQPLEPAIFKEN